MIPSPPNDSLDTKSSRKKLKNGTKWINFYQYFLYNYGKLWHSDVMILAKQMSEVVTISSKVCSLLFELAGETLGVCVSVFGELVLLVKRQGLIKVVTDARQLYRMFLSSILDVIILSYVINHQPAFYTPSISHVYFWRWNIIIRGFQIFVQFVLIKTDVWFCFH